MTELYYIVKLDGDKWCAHYSDFVNLQESPASFGDTAAQALQDFINSRTIKAKLIKE